MEPGATEAGNNKVTKQGLNITEAEDDRIPGTRQGGKSTTQGTPLEGYPPLPEGDTKETLLAMRHELAERIPNAANRDVSPMVIQMRMVLHALQAMDAKGHLAPDDVVDELLERRGKKRAAGE